MNTRLFGLFLFLITLTPTALAQGGEPVGHNGWLEFRPGGDTICAHGTPYAYYVRPGRNDQVVINFMGGGACWTGGTCEPGSITFRGDIDDLLGQGPGSTGVFDHENPDNPYYDWTHVFVPYCTGDVHWGAIDRTYTTAREEITVHHRGAINAQAALDGAAAYTNLAERIAVQGCSAGSYGSIYWSPYIQEQHPQAQLIQFGDAGAGVLTDNFRSTGLMSWNPTQHAPSWIPALDPATTDWSTLHLEDFYVETAKYYPTMRLSQYNANSDFTQMQFFRLMGGSMFSWSGLMRDAMADIYERTDDSQFRFFVGSGTSHCATGSESFYSLNRDGVYLRDWLKGRIDGAPIDNIGR